MQWYPLGQLDDNRKLIEATILTGSFKEVVLLPRIPMTPSDYTTPFKKNTYLRVIQYLFVGTGLRKSSGEHNSFGSVFDSHDRDLWIESCNDLEFMKNNMCFEIK